MRRDVVIIGAGPVGLTTALLFARQGLRVEVLEKRVTPCTEPRAVSVDDEGLRVWQACGVLDLLRDDIVSGEPGQCICTYLDATDRPFLRIHQRVSELGHPHAAAIHQGRVEAKLLQAAERNPSIIVRRGVTVNALAQDDESVSVRWRDADGREGESVAAWSIACDGARSVVREALGISVSATDLPRPWLVANVVDRGDPGHVMIRCRASGAAVTMPLPHGIRRVEVELNEDDHGAWLSDDDRVRRLLRQGWDGVDDAEIVTRSIARFKYAIADRWRVGRVFLAGDAAHQMPPFAGQGLGAGLRDAANLAFKIAGVTQGWLTSEALDSYEQERRPHVEKILRLVERLSRLMTPASKMRGAFLHGVMRGVSIVEGLGESWKLRGPEIQPCLSRGLLVPRGEAGTYLPQPMVVGVGRGAIPLDELLGPRMTWLMLAGKARHADVLEAPTIHSGDRVLVEGRDFQDPGKVLQRKFGVGSRVLVRPDRVVCLHLVAPRGRFGFLRRETCPVSLSALREVRPLVAPTS